MTNDNHAWEELCELRTKPLCERFPGYYRSMVVETNDPLNMYRVKFKCPDMHDYNLTADQCPWAVPAPELGGKRAGRFVHPVIGDWIKLNDKFSALIVIKYKARNFFYRYFIDLDSNTVKPV